MIFIYRLFYLLIKVILQILKPVFSLKFKLWLELRNKNIEKNKIFKNSYWFHASSGEIEYCKAVIRLLKEQNPAAQIIVTYSSPSAEKLFFNVTEYVDQFIPLPWDQPKPINELIAYINPQILVFAKTDLWPELITQAKNRNIKIGLISYNPSLCFISQKINNWLIRKLDFITTIEKNGDTRFDQVFYRLEQSPKIKIISETASLKLFVAGSTWPEDEVVLFDAFPELLKQNFKIILSPHEVSDENILRIQKELIKRQHSFQILSNELDPLRLTLKNDVLIINKIGFLADAYRFADLAFVGGSFKNKIHSVMEPLCCGVPVLTGPYYKNNLEAIKYQGKFVFAIQTSVEFILSLTQLSSISKIDILTEMKKNKNASAAALELLNTHSKF